MTKCYDISKFTAGAILFREIQRKKMDILMFSSVFRANLVELGKICKNNDHTCLFQCILHLLGFEEAVYT